MRQNTVFSTKNTKNITPDPSHSEEGDTPPTPHPSAPTAPRPPPCWNPAYATTRHVGNRTYVL